MLAITFAVFYLLPAGDPALRFAGKNPTTAQLALIHQRLGLDKPWYVQFGKFTKNFFLGDQYGWPGLGYTYAGQTSVKALIIARAPRTLFLIIGASILWLFLGVADRRDLGGEAPNARRPVRHGVRALRDLDTGLLARPDGPLHLLAASSAGRAAPATSRPWTAFRASSRT